MLRTGLKMNEVLLERMHRGSRGAWDSIIAVIGDDAKSELAGVRRFSLLPL